MRAIALVLGSICVSLLLTACGGGGGTSSAAPVAATTTTTTTTTTATSGYPGIPLNCTTATRRLWLRDYMNDQYFWYDRQGTPNASATTLDDYFASLLFLPTDRYSFSLTTAQFTQTFVEGQAIGYGYQLTFADAAQTIIKARFVEPAGPVGTAGLVRGDTIVSINGLTPAQIASGALASVSTAGVPRTFVVANAAGVQRTINVVSAVYSLTPVFATKVLTATNGSKVGYLGYQEFINTSTVNTALANAINTLRAGGVTEVILDLRYNGGGSTTSARNLSSLLGGAALNGRLFANYKYNAKNTGSNFSQAFTSSTVTLLTAPLEGLSRVFIITASGTASASEMVMNGLTPYKSVITVGATSFGKPYAFQPIDDSCGTTYNAVNIEISNANSVVIPTTGVPARCVMSDDLTRQLGDPAELRTAAALSFITTGVCPPVASFNTASAGLNSGDSTATSGAVRDQALGEDGRPLPAPRGARLD